MTRAVLAVWSALCVAAAPEPTATPPRVVLGKTDAVKIHVRTLGKEALRVAGIDEAGITPIAPSLEDVFLALSARAPEGTAP